MDKLLSNRCQTVIVFLLLLGQTAGLILLTEQAAQAYVDPGAGLLVFQMLAASIVGGFYLLRRKLRALFGRYKPSPQLPPQRSDCVPNDFASGSPAARRSGIPGE